MRPAGAAPGAPTGAAPWQEAQCSALAAPPRARSAFAGDPASPAPSSAARPALAARASSRSLPQRRTLRSLRALPITETEDRLMAAAATMGERRSPSTG